MREPNIALLLKRLISNILRSKGSLRYFRLGKRLILRARGRSEEINTITSTHYAYLAGVALVITPVKINRNRTIAIIDLGATGNFISREVVIAAQLPTRKRKEPYVF